eukprot:ANDGO_00576.mRNA.1 hypothetical protein
MEIDCRIEVCASLGNLVRGMVPAMFSDVTMHVESHVFPAHKCILAARSPVLARILASTPSITRLRILSPTHRIPPAAVRALLDYVYTGSLVLLDPEGPGLASTDATNGLTLLLSLCHLLAMSPCDAIFRALQPSVNARLDHTCILLASLVLSPPQSSSTSHTVHMAAIAVAAFVHHALVVFPPASSSSSLDSSSSSSSLLSSAIYILPRAVILFILSLPCLPVPELAFFKMLVGWGSHHHFSPPPPSYSSSIATSPSIHASSNGGGGGGGGMTREELGAVLDELLGYIDFSAIEAHDLATIVEPLGLVRPAALLDAYRRIALLTPSSPSPSSPSSPASLSAVLATASITQAACRGVSERRRRLSVEEWIASEEGRAQMLALCSSRSTTPSSSAAATQIGSEESGTRGGEAPGVVRLRVVGEAGDAMSPRSPFLEKEGGSEAAPSSPGTGMQLSLRKPAFKQRV